MDRQRIKEIETLLESVPKSPWNYSEGSEFDHWEIWSSHFLDGYSLVQDDSGVPPDACFINFVLQSRDIIEELLNEVKKT